MDIGGEMCADDFVIEEEVDVIRQHTMGDSTDLGSWRDDSNDGKMSIYRGMINILRLQIP